MSILSVQFLGFLLLLLGLYYICPKVIKPYVLLCGSIFFFLQFDIRYSIFLLFSILSTFFGALGIQKVSSQKSKKFILSIVLIANIGLLLFVKFTPYLTSLVQRVIPFETPAIVENLLVPIGISFYTLQVSGYIFDVYKGKYEAENNFAKFASFSTFFPLMLQGPISRYNQLGDQLFTPVSRDTFYYNLRMGSQLMLWGFFKKLVIADRAALLVNQVFNDYTKHSGLIILVAIFLYTIQIYTDFSGCVDICRGSAKLFGIDIIENFKQPYFSKSIQDFWRRWHIALSSWFRDYLYIPLGGNRKGTFRKYLNLMIVFFASGIWHGVGLHYIVWGVMQGAFQIAGALTLSYREKLCKKLHIDRTKTIYGLFQMAFTFVLVNLSWLMFRANGTIAAIRMFFSVFRPSAEAFNLPGITKIDALILLGALAILLVVSILKEKGINIREKITSLALPLRWTIYLTAFVLILILGLYGPGYSDSAFIYMNF